MPTYTAEQTKQTKDLLAKGDALGKDAAQKSGLAYTPVLPTPTPIVSTDGSIDATSITPAPQVNLPEPAAPAAAETFQLGLEAAAEQARTSLDETLATQRDEAVKRQEDASKRLQDILSKSNPENRATYGQEEQIVRNQLKAAEAASSTLEEDFNSRRRIVGELETLLTEGNNLIRQQQGLPVAQRVVSQMASRAIQDVQARAGVLQAVVAGLDGNIALAHSLIDTASTAVRARWQDMVSYNNAVLQLAANKELAIEGEHKKFAEEQLGMAKSKLAGIETTIQTIKDGMVNPQTARAYAEAGVTLNDSVEEISMKLAVQNRRQVDREAINSLMLTLGQQGTPADVVRQIGTFESFDEALSFAAPYMQSEESRLAIQGLRISNALHSAQLEKAQAELHYLNLYGGMSPSEYRAYEKEKKKELAEAADADEHNRLQSQALDEKITLIDGIINSDAMDTTVGTTPLSRGPSGFWGTAGRTASIAGIPAVVGTGWDKLTGSRQNFIGSVEQLVSREFLDNLIQAKAAGATFGALTIPEQQALTAAATKIGKWRIEDGDGKVLGYNASEADFIAELTTIQTLATEARNRIQGSVFTPEEEAVFEEFDTGFDPALFFKQ